MIRRYSKTSKDKEPEELLTSVELTPDEYLEVLKGRANKAHVEITTLKAENTRLRRRIELLEEQIAEEDEEIEDEEEEDSSIFSQRENALTRLRTMFEKLQESGFIHAGLKYYHDSPDDNLYELMIGVSSAIQAYKSTQVERNKWRDESTKLQAALEKARTSLLEVLPKGIHAPHFERRTFFPRRLTPETFLTVVTAAVNHVRVLQGSLDAAVGAAKPDPQDGSSVASASGYAGPIVPVPLGVEKEE